MNRTFGSILFSIFGALCFFGVRYYDQEQDMRQQMDAMIDKKIADGLEVPLDCPPFGKLSVKFNAETSSPEIATQNMLLIIKQWGALWPAVYKAIDEYEKDDKSRDLLLKNPEVQVDLPNAELTDNQSWAIEYSCEAGHFLIDLTGMKVVSVQIS